MCYNSFKIILYSSNRDIYLEMSDGMKHFSEQKHHALMAALIYRQICRQCPENSGEIIKKVVSDYGAARGRIARENTISMGDALTVANYMAYKSLRTPDGGFIENVLENGPDLITQVTKCCWIDTWKKYGLLDYGKMYCEHCDDEMMKAYNREITMEIPQLAEHDGKDTCVFIWRDTQVSYEELRAKKKLLGNRFVLTWQQLTDHLVACAKASLDEVEDGLSNRIIDAALTEFEAIPD